MRPGEKPEIAHLPPFSDMSETERERLFEASFLQVFPPQLVLFREGETADFLYIVIDGLVELFASMGGSDTTLRLVEPTRSFILAAAVTDQPYLMSARTLSASRIMLIPARLLREVIKSDPAMMQATMNELSLSFREMVRSISDLKLRSSTQRLANFLLQQDRQQQRGGLVRLPAEKKLIASLLGMSPENLSRSFQALEKFGVSRQGDTIVIGSPQAIEHLA